MEEAETQPEAGELAQQLGLSVSHFHRLFKQHTGLTPRGWWQGQREARMRGQLDAGTPVTTAIHEAGYQSSSRFYEKADQALGMTASRRRRGGAGEEIRFAVGQCALGAILVAQSSRGICAILMGEDPQALVQDLQERFPNADLTGGDAQFEQTVALVVGLVQAPGTGLSLPLDLQGTAFQKRVWQALSKVPAGQTITYAELARRIGAPSAVRAVGSACGANALAVAIPCHRALRSDGGLSGYRWGLERKRALLDLEAQQAAEPEEG
jgi:AraC family transcriptional regulator of adaptative response/methylated-DNA-[protein]-cysteine methyltransferase